MALLRSRYGKAGDFTPNSCKVVGRLDAFVELRVDQSNVSQITPRQWHAANDERDAGCSHNVGASRLREPAVVVDKVFEGFVSEPHAPSHGHGR
ncbi:hypothetical protein [Frigoribacterium faeni]|uniref:hypothetical protein n=1 Tax=Frigoribacterium faeni TaxID=145483 RepID=UPI002413324C|nr:hypothetical protein [Frigoribacterium faeni]